MKNTIKKAEMNGQWMDMQKTRGGVPSCLREYYNVVAHRNMLEKNGIRWITGRTGWANKISPIDRLFVHRTDDKKAQAIVEFCRAHDMLTWSGMKPDGRNKDNDARIMREREKLTNKAKELYAAYGFKLTPKYAKLQKALS